MSDDLFFCISLEGSKRFRHRFKEIALRNLSQLRVCVGVARRGGVTASLLAERLAQPANSTGGCASPIYPMILCNRSDDNKIS